MFSLINLDEVRSIDRNSARIYIFNMVSFFETALTLFPQEERENFKFLHTNPCSSSCH